MVKNKSGFPFNHVVGFLLSITLTILAAMVALKTDFSVKVIMWIIGSFAVLQAGVQLFMFMHATEGKDGKANMINLAYSIFLAAVIVFGSIWILTSGHMAH